MEWILIAIAVLVLVSQQSSGSPAPDSSGPSTISMADAIDVAAGTAGIEPRVLMAIEAHETGDYSSRLWTTANNPGGLKYSEYESLGMDWGYVTLDDDAPGEKFAKYPNPTEGILGHGRFLAQSRYAAARATSDPQGQINAIAAAGYATDPLWRVNVWAKYQQIGG